MADAYSLRRKSEFGIQLAELRWRLRAVSSLTLPQDVGTWHAPSAPLALRNRLRLSQHNSRAADATAHAYSTSGERVVPPTYAHLRRHEDALCRRRRRGFGRQELHSRHDFRYVAAVTAKSPGMLGLGAGFLNSPAPTRARRSPRRITSVRSDGCRGQSQICFAGALRRTRPLPRAPCGQKLPDRGGAPTLWNPRPRRLY